MKRRNRVTSVAATASSSKDIATSELSRLPSMNFDLLTPSPQIKKIHKPKRGLKIPCEKYKLSPIEILEFKSAYRRKKFKLKVFNEADKLIMNKRLQKKLKNTPETDFDCPSDDELIAETVARKSNELRAALNKKRVFR